MYTFHFSAMPKTPENYTTTKSFVKGKQLEVLLVVQLKYYAEGSVSNSACHKIQIHDHIPKIQFIHCSANMY